MSTRPYSIDLREKVIKYIESGKTQRSASKVFLLSPTTINKWCVRYKNEGHCRPRKRIGAKPSISKEDFIKYVEENLNMRTEDFAKRFGISVSGIKYWLKKLGFSYKKKPSAMWKLIKRSEGPT